MLCDKLEIRKRSSMPFLWGLVGEGYSIERLLFLWGVHST